MSTALAPKAIKLTVRGEGVGFEANTGRAQGAAQGRGGRGFRLGQQCLDERLAKQEAGVVTDPLNHEKEVTCTPANRFVCREVVMLCLG